MPVTCIVCYVECISLRSGAKTLQRGRHSLTGNDTNLNFVSMIISRKYDILEKSNRQTSSLNSKKERLRSP